MRLLALAIVSLAVLFGCSNSGPTTPNEPRAATAAPAAAAEPAPSPEPATPAPPAPPVVGDPAAPWGPPVPSPDIEALVAAQLGRMRDGKLEAGDFKTAVVFGPGLWSTWQLGGLNSSEGIPMVARVKTRDRMVLAHGRAIRFAALGPFLASAPVRELGARFADGDIGPANATERQLYYAGISWEITGRPITVARKGGEVLVVVHGDGRDIFHVELLGPWQRLLSGQATEIESFQPPGPTR